MATPQQRKARKDAAAQWLHQQLVLSKERRVVEEEALEHLRVHCGSAAAEREAADREFLLHEREVRNSIRIVRANPRKLLERAMESNDEAVAKLRQVERVLGSAADEADTLIAQALEMIAASQAAHRSREAEAARKRPASADVLRAEANRSTPAARAQFTGAVRRASSGARAPSPVKASSMNNAVSEVSKVARPKAAKDLTGYQRDVAAVDEFVAAHGGTLSLGWPDDLHREFLQVLAVLQSHADSDAATRTPGALRSTALPQPAAQTAFDRNTDAEIGAQLARSMRTTVPQPQLVEHISHYRQYLALVESKRLAVEAWRDAKRVEKLHVDRIAEIQQQRAADTAVAEAKLLEDRRLARLKRSADEVHKWRAARELEANCAAVAQAAAQRQHAANAEVVRKLQAVRVAAHAEVNRQALTRVREARVIHAFIERDENRATANVVLKNRQEEAAEFAMRRRAMMEAARKPKVKPHSSASAAGGNQAARPRSASSDVSRDPSRLTRQTASSTARSQSVDTTATPRMTRGVTYLTPRNNHFTRSPASWCGFEFMR